MKQLYRVLYAKAIEYVDKSKLAQQLNSVDSQHNAAPYPIHTDNHS